jgi:hypothetical protein
MEFGTKYLASGTEEAKSAHPEKRSGNIFAFHQLGSGAPPVRQSIATSAQILDRRCAHGNLVKTFLLCARDVTQDPKSMMPFDPVDALSIRHVLQYPLPDARTYRQLQACIAS